MSFGQQLKLTVMLSLPAMLAQLSSILMQYIDASMVGRLGADDSAAIGLVSARRGSRTQRAATGHNRVPHIQPRRDSHRHCHRTLAAPLARWQRRHQPPGIALLPRVCVGIALAHAQLPGGRNVAMRRQHEGAERPQHSHVYHGLPIQLPADIPVTSPQPARHRHNHSRCRTRSARCRTGNRARRSRHCLPHALLPLLPAARTASARPPRQLSSPEINHTQGGDNIGAHDR